MSKRKKKNHKTERKVYPNWQSLSGGTRSLGYYDVNHSLREPNATELIAAEESAVAACVKTIVNSLADIEVRLYTTNPQNGARQLRVGGLERKGLLSQRRVSGLVRKSMGVSQVLDHRLLDLLDNPNESQDYFQFLKLVQRFLEITGNAFVWIQFDDQDRYPCALYPLPTQKVKLLRSERTGLVEFYEFGWGDEKATFTPDEIIHFVADADLLDPYGLGISPLRMVWQQVQLGRKEASYWDSLLTNAGRPEVVISPKDSDTFLTEDQKERIAKDFVQAFQGGNAGYPLVLDGNLGVDKLTYTPKDMATFELFQQIKESICNAYGVPLTVFETPDSTLSSAGAGQVFYAQHTIKPRINGFLGMLNKKLTPYFADNLFLAAHNYLPVDRAFELQEDIALADRQALTVNEIREKRGLPPLKDGDRPISIGVPSIGTTHEEVPGISAPPAQQGDGKPDTPQQAPAAASNDLRATVGGSVAIADLQRSYYRNELPRDSCIANAVLIFGFSEEEAQRLFPVLAPDAPTQQSAEQPPAQQPATEASLEGIEEKELDEAEAEVTDSPLAAALKDIFARQREATLEALEDFSLKSVTTRSVLTDKDLSMPSYVWKAKPEKDYLDLSHWSEEMAEELFPIIEGICAAEAERTSDKLSLSPSIGKVVQPKIREHAMKLTLQFCDETNQTTSLILSDALARLREELGEGLEQGETRAALTQRVKEVFDQASTTRADMIAATEQRRASEAASLTVAKESGVVQGKRWLPASNACDVCHGIARRGTIGLDDTFASIGSGPYSEVTTPPAHPRCRCSQTYDLKE